MAVIRIKDFIDNNDFAGSRQNGLKVRECILKKQKDSTGITLDFTNVDLITQSFADEVIGILTRMNGVDFIKEHIRLNNANDEIKSVFNYVVKYSQKYFVREAA